MEEPRLNHTVYVYKCDNCVVQVNAKCNSIVLDTCSRVGLVFEACVSVVEVINCKAIKVQVKRKSGFKCPPPFVAVGALLAGSRCWR